MLEIKLPRRKLIEAILDHVENNEGVYPEIEDDEDLIKWGLRLFEYHMDEDEPAPTITVKGDNVTIAGNQAVTEIVQKEIL